MTEPDNDPAHMAIMEAWVRRIVTEVAQDMADGIVERVGRIFLDAKTSNHAMAEINRQRFQAIEAMIADLRARTKGHG